MKILFLCNNDLASLFAANLLKPILENHQVVFGQSSHVGGKQSHPEAIKRLVEVEKKFISDLASDSAIGLFSKVLPVQSSKKIINFDQVASKFDRQMLQLNHINSRQGIELVMSLYPDLIVSIRFGKILQQPIIDIPKLGVINLHSGLLPGYQGVMATFWAMLNGEKNSGCCLHFVQDKQIDAGDIIQQSLSLIDYNQSYLENLLSIYKPGVQMIANAVADLNLGKKLESQQQQGESRYFSFPTTTDIKHFEQQGLRLF